MDDALERELAEPQRLAVRHAPRATYSATLVVLALDGRMATIVRRRGEPMLAQMRLAWWRDILSEPCEKWPLGEPVLAALRSWRNPQALSALADGWEHLLKERLDPGAIDGFSRGREAAFAALAEQLGEDPDIASRAARTWAIADLAANLSDPQERLAVVNHAGQQPPVALPRSLRPLAILSALGRRSLAGGGRPLLEGRGAAATAFRVGLIGR